LEKINLGEKKIVCPLSYERGQYAYDIKKFGEEKLGENFIPVLEYLPKEKYDQLLGSISYGIMNHNRSQALGNIVVLLWNGTKLFMSEDSTLYQHFKKYKLIVFPFQSAFKKENKNLFDKLTEDEILINQKILLEMFGERGYLEKIKILLTL
jgi:hypothetical protein